MPPPSDNADNKPKLTQAGEANTEAAKTDAAKTDAEWRETLPAEVYQITRRHATEPAFSHPYNEEKSKGMYACACCGKPLFDAETKFDSGTGWPSFFAPAADDAIAEHADRSLFMRRTEVRCKACDAHLGHVFPDGPAPTGQRYCINGLALKLKPSED